MEQAWSNDQRTPTTDLTLQYLDERRRAAYLTVKQAHDAEDDDLATERCELLFKIEQEILATAPESAIGLALQLAVFDGTSRDPTDSDMADLAAHARRVACLK